MTTPSGHTSAICAKKVTGTAVQDRAGNKIGTIEDVVLDKLSNNIMFAVVSFGGFLGMNEKYHPVPWASLDYDPEEGSYTVDLTRERLEAAPAASLDELITDDASRYRDQAFDYYKAPRYWEKPLSRN